MKTEMTKSIELTAWERSMVRGMISELKKRQKLTDMETVWVEAMRVKFDETK